MPAPTTWLFVLQWTLQLVVAGRVLLRRDLRDGYRMATLMNREAARSARDLGAKLGASDFRRLYGIDVAEAKARMLVDPVVTARFHERR